MKKENQANIFKNYSLGMAKNRRGGSMFGAEWPELTDDEVRGKKKKKKRWSNYIGCWEQN